MMRSIFRPAILAIALCALAAASCSSQREEAISALHHFNRGNAAYRIEDYTRAITHFNRALELDEGAADVYYNLGLAYYRSGNYKLAVAALNSALAARPGLADAHFNLALAYDRLYNPDSAHAHYESYRAMVGGRRKNSTQTPAASRFGGGARGPAISQAAPTSAAGPQPVRQTARGAPQGQHPAVPSGNATGVRRQPAVRARPAPRQAAPATGAQTMQNPSGDQQKWWIQDNLNRAR